MAKREELEEAAGRLYRLGRCNWSYGRRYLQRLCLPLWMISIRRIPANELSPAVKYLRAFYYEVPPELRPDVLKMADELEAFIKRRVGSSEEIPRFEDLRKFTESLTLCLADAHAVLEQYKYAVYTIAPQATWGHHNYARFDYSSDPRQLELGSSFHISYTEAGDTLKGIKLWLEPTKDRWGRSAWLIRGAVKLGPMQKGFIRDLGRSIDAAINLSHLVGEMYGHNEYLYSIVKKYISVMIRLIKLLELGIPLGFVKKDVY